MRSCSVGKIQIYTCPCAVQASPQKAAKQALWEPFIMYLPPRGYPREPWLRSLLSMNRLRCSEMGSCNPVGRWAPSTPRLWKKNQVLENLSPMLSLRGKLLLWAPKVRFSEYQRVSTGKEGEWNRGDSKGRKECRAAYYHPPMWQETVTHLHLAVACPFDYTLRSPGAVPKPGDPSPT